MAIQVYCNCGNPLIVPAELGGHKVKCKVCQTVLRIPELPAGAKPEDNEADKLAQSGDYEVVAEDTIQLSCPSCGALAAPEDSACLSCGADLAGGAGGGGGGGIPKLSGIPKNAKLGVLGVVVLLVLGVAGYMVHQASRPSAFASEGFQLLQQRDFNGARLAFTTSLEHEPNYPDAMIGMAEVGAAQNRVGEIRRYVRPAIKLITDPRRRAVLRLALARTDLDDENYREAYNGAIEAKDDDDSLAGIDDVRGLAMLGLDQRDEALEVLELAARAHSDDYRVYYRLAELQREQEDFKPAQVNAEKAVKLKPEDPGLWLLLSELREKNGQNRGAKEALVKVVELDPENAAAQSRLSRLHLNDGEYDEALARSKEAQRLAPDNMEVQLSVGRILLSQGKAKEASEELTRVVKVARTWEAEFLLGQALLKLDNSKEAVPRIASALKLRPEDLALHLQAAKLLLDAGVGGLASEWVSHVLKTTPENYDALLLYSQTLAAKPSGRRQFHDVIVQSLEQAIRLEPERGSAALELGQHHMEALDPEAAIAAFDLGLQASGSDKELLYWKGRACVRAKSWDDAVETLEHLKRISPSYQDVDTWLRRAEEGRFYDE